MQRQGQKQQAIRKKIQQSGLTKAQQFQQVISTLINQRQRLEQDLRLLRQKTIELQDKKTKIDLKSNQRSNSIKRIQYQQQLKRKKQQLRKLQTLNKSSKTINMQYQQYINKLAYLQQQIKKQIQKYNDQRMTYKKLKKAYKVIMKDYQINSSAQMTVYNQNSELRKRVYSLRKIVDKQIKKQNQLHSYLQDFNQRLVTQPQQQIVRYKKSSASSKRSKTISNKSQVVSDSSSQQFGTSFIVENIEQPKNQDQVDQLQGVYNRYENQVRVQLVTLQNKIKSNYANQILLQKRQGSKLTYGKQFELILQKCKQNLRILIDIFRDKIKLVAQQIILQQNQIERKQNQQKMNLTKTVKAKINYIPTYQNQQIQTQNYLIAKQLRKQYGGLITQLLVDDRIILGQQRATSIKQIWVYHSDRGIATVRAKYMNFKQNKQILGASIVPQSFLDNFCKRYIIETSKDDFLKYFKIRYNVKEKRIIAIKIVTNKGIKLGFGEHKDKQIISFNQKQQKQYIFDIDKDQFPISVFFAHVQKGPYWYLCGFGVQVDG